MSLPAAKPDHRRLLLGLAHKAAVQLGMDEDTRREAQRAFAGKESLKDFTDAELLAWCWQLKEWGANIGIPLLHGAPAVSRDRPTRAQWATIERLAAAIGIEKAALAAFVRRTTGLDDPRFMTRRDASYIISGLTRWAQGRGIDTRSKTRQAVETLLEDSHG